MHKDIEFMETVISFYDLMRKIYVVTHVIFIIGIPPVFIVIVLIIVHKLMYRLWKLCTS